MELQAACDVICEEMRSIHGPSRTSVYAGLAAIKGLFRQLDKEIRDGKL